jgi:hypothetical protein
MSSDSFAIANRLDRSRLRFMPKNRVVLKMHPKTKKLLSELKDWCDQGFGRRSEVARLLGVPRSLITEWFANTRIPNLDQGFVIQDFLRQSRSGAKHKPATRKEES